MHVICHVQCDAEFAVQLRSSMYLYWTTIKDILPAVMPPALRLTPAVDGQVEEDPPPPPSPPQLVVARHKLLDVLKLREGRHGEKADALVMRGVLLRAWGVARPTDVRWPW